MALNSSTVAQNDDVVAGDHNELRQDIQQHTHEGADTEFIKKLVVKTVNAGETINGATLPVPVYQDQADGELYACDANVTTKLQFIGFAISNSTNGNPINFQTDGIISGFSGLTAGAQYYVQDAVGTIGTTPGTYQVLVGIAISATEILILKQGLVAKGQTSRAAAAGTGNEVISHNLGVIPKLIKFYAFAGVNYHSIGNWGEGAADNNCVGVHSTGVAFASATQCIYLYQDANPRVFAAVCGTVTKTQFTLAWTMGSAGFSGTAYVLWEAYA